MVWISLTKMADQSTGIKYKGQGKWNTKNHNNTKTNIRMEGMGNYQFQGHWLSK